MRFPGFLRVGMADPLPDRKFFRRGWVTFRRDVNIKEICWNLNNFRVTLSHCFVIHCLYIYFLYIGVFFFATASNFSLLTLFPSHYFQVRDCDLGAIVNRDLARRVRSVNGITGHKQVAQNDLQLAAKLVTVFDKKVPF